MSIFFTLALMAVVFVVSELLRPKPKMEDIRPSSIGDFNFPTATQGRVVPLVWGTVMIGGPNVVWYGDLQQDAIKKKMKTGMFTSKRIVTGYRYHVGMQFGLCRGEIDSLRRILVDEKEVFSGAQGAGVIPIDEPDLFGGDDLGSGGLVGDLRVHVGTVDQGANVYLAPFQDVSGDSPRYQGTCYCVLEQGYIGNSTSIAPWKFEVRRIPNGLALGVPSVNDGNDCNPMNVVYEIMTNTEWGLGFPPADIDTADFTAAAATLLTEGNGFSFGLESPMEAVDLLNEVERQVDGIVFMDHRTGKWKIKLARGGYDINTVPQLDEDNLVELSDFSRGAWEDTTNQVRVGFSSRVLDYKEDFALAQDIANAMIQGGGTPITGVNISVTEKYPGVKNGDLANQIAWRDLRTLSYPLAKATFVVDRSFWDVTPGDVIAWTDTDLGFTKLPMRILRIDYGELRDGRITLSCVQDVFQFQVGAFAAPPGTGWTPPADTLVAFPADEQMAIEAPRALVARDPDLVGLQDRIWAGARRQGPEVSFKIMERHAAGVPAGDYTEVGEAFGFLRIGKLKNDLAIGTAIPTASFLVLADPDAKATIEAAFDDDPDLAEQGKNLLNMVLVGNEFMLPCNAAINGDDVQLNNVYRGMLDTTQLDHSANDAVWLVFVGGGLIDTTIPDGQNVDVKLLPRSLSDQLAIGDATEIEVVMDDRLIRPYVPGWMELNTVLFPAGNVDLDHLHAGSQEITGILLDYARRDFRTAEGGDEIEALSTDAETIFPDFPSVNNTTHEVEVRNDPAGANTLLFTDTGIVAATQDILRIKILRDTNGVVPSRMRLVLTSKHDAGGKTDLASRYALAFDFDTVSAALAGQFNFGSWATNLTSNLYTVVTAGQHNFWLTSAYTVGNVIYQVNGVGWNVLILAGAVVGNIPGLIIGDTIRLSHQSFDVGALKQIDMVEPGAGKAYGIPYTA